MQGDLQSGIEILAAIMALTALGIVSVGAIQHMIRLYQAQSLILALLTLLIAREPDIAQPTTRIFLGAFAVFIPCLLAYIIEPLLAQATVPREQAPWSERLGHSFLRVFSPQYRQESGQLVGEARAVWLEHGLSPQRQRSSALISLALTATAYVTASHLITDPERAQSLAVSTTLLLLGFFTMISQRDLISQILGLLVMDHGLFLATVWVTTLPSLIPTFIISLFLYILITLVILMILLPELHAQSKTINVAEQNELQG
jgi:hydrogenase-4 membrane subunit HyfE